MTYALLGLIALVLLAGLVAFGVGHKRWSWGTLVAAFLVLLTAAGYLYLASRFAAYEWSWASFLGKQQVELAKVRDAMVPDAATGGRLRPLAGGGDDLATKPLTELAQERDRWQRVLDKVDTWRGRSWTRASFEPPKADGAAGKLEIPFVANPPAPAAEGDPAAPPPEPVKPGEPPLDAGATVYLFEDVPAQEGGRYLGAFLVQAAEPDVPGGRFVYTVAQTEPRDAYDAAVWNRTYESVTVFETLPTDHWLAFSKTAEPDAAAPPADEPKRLTIQQVEELLEERDRQQAFLAEFEKDGTVVDKADWDAIRRRLDEGSEQAGSYWAVVTFKEPAVIAEQLAAGRPEKPADESAEPAAEDADGETFAAGASAECDLQRAFALADEGKVTIDEVRYRRRLQDAGTFIHGSRVFADGVGPKEGIAADGVAALRGVLLREIASLTSSAKRLAESRTDVETELKLTEDRRRRLAADKENWDRDAEVAVKTSAAFATEVAHTRERLAATERAIVAHGNELREAVGRLVERIDAVAPAPTRPTGTP